MILSFPSPLCNFATTPCLWPCSGQEGSVAGEGGEGPASEGEPAGGPQEEAGGAAAQGGETPSSAGGEAEAETREEQGQRTGEFGANHAVFQSIALIINTALIRL